MNMILCIMCLVSLHLTSTDNYDRLTERDDILGMWLTEKNEGIVEIYKTSGQYYHAKLIGGRSTHEQNGSLRKDINNANATLRNRTLVGILIFHDMQFDAELKRWQGGTVYDPTMGHQAQGIITVLDSNSIQVKGYIGFEWFSKSQIWKRKIN